MENEIQLGADRFRFTSFIGLSEGGDGGGVGREPRAKPGNQLVIYIFGLCFMLL